MKWPRLPRFRARPPGKRPSGSLTRRMIGISALWIVLLLGLGGYALDRVLTSAVTANFDSQLDYVLTAMIASSEIGPDGTGLCTAHLRLVRARETVHKHAQIGV